MAELLSQEPAAAAALLSILAAAMRPEGADVEVCAADYAWSLAAQGWRQQAIFTVCNLVLQVTLLPHSRHALSALHFVHATLCTQPFHAYSRQLAAAAAYFEGSRSGGSSGRGGAGSNGNGTGSGSGGGAGSGSGSGAGSSSGGGTGSGSGSWPASGSGGGPGRAGSSGHLQWGTSKALQLAVGALTCGRLLLPRQRPLPQLEAQREEWWRLAVCAALYGLMKAEGYLQQLWGLVTAPLLAVWPNGVLDLDALPPAAPPEVAAALAGELPLLLCSVLDPDYSTRSAPLITACERARPDGSGLALFLTPLLAYGEEGQCNLILRNLAGLRVGAGTSSSSGPYEPASKFLYHDAPEAIRRCRGLAGAGHASAAGAEQLGTAAAGSSAARSAAVGPPPRHLHNFRWRLEGARELWAVPSTTGMRVVGSASAPPDPASAVASLPAAAPSASARQAAACACTSAALGRLQELSLRATEILRCARAHLASADETLKGGSGSATFRGAASAAAAEQRATAAVVGSGAAEMPLGLPLGFGQPRALTEGMWEEALPVSSPGGGGVLSSVAGASPGVDAAADGPMAAAAGSSSASASASPAARERLLGLSPGCQSSVPKAEHDQAQGPPWEILTKVKACGAEVLQTEETKVTTVWGLGGGRGAGSLGMAQMKLVAATRDLLASLGEAPEELDDTVALHRSGNGAFSLKVRDMVTTGKVEEVLAMCAVQVDEMVAKPVPDVEDAGGAACRAAPKGDSAGGGSSPAEVAAAEPCSAAAPAQVTAAEAGDGGAVAALDAEEARSAAAAAARIAPHALAGLRRGANPRVAVASPPLRVNLTRTHQTTSYTVGQVAVLAGPRCGANPRAAVASPPQTHAASAFARPAAACASASAALKRLLELSELATETMLWAPAQGSADEAPESGSSSADARGRAPSTAAEQPSTASPVTSAAGSGAVQAPLELPLRFGQPWALAAETARKALLVRSLGCGSATASAAGLLTGPAAEPPAASAGSASLTAASAMSSSATAAAAIASPTTPTAVTASCPSMATAATAARERLLGLSRGCQSSVPKAEHDQAHGALTEILTKVKACGAEVLQTEETKVTTVRGLGGGRGAGSLGMAQMKLVAATRDLLASLGEAPEELDDTVALNRSDDGAFSLKVRDMLTAGRVEEARALWTGQVEEVAAKLASVAERAGSSAGPPAAPKGQRAGGGATFGAVAADGAGGGTAAAAAVAMAAPQEHLGWFGALLWQAVWVLVVLGVSAALCMWGWV
ncbi:hypothetical protein HYH03_013006 [Edaphochlamys debaryana]|uniref:Uncharacterized protein n=1 Tax=Edaphochlamys debaryana TaxID=47281 RepID=A0A836BUZ1_9CHLO|nr:hypothetical protein HYH03_013006 [Edaphochlamys debaryana]|eukprot:KAG2488503.1 hypothetical protein HYH03_013006 [Edaphochlamys debaryana]